jgi:hypothetical protein
MSIFHPLRSMAKSDNVGKANPPASKANSLFLNDRLDLPTKKR